MVYGRNVGPFRHGERQGVHPAFQVRGGHHGRDPGQATGCFQVDAAQDRVGHGAAHHHQVE